jgi:xanthine dehydrogenase iron-sulfur cluster and FAD-binding subunit A
MVGNDQVIQKALIAFGGVAAMTRRAKRTEQFLTGKTWNREVAVAASKILGGEFQPISDARSTAEARKIMTSNLLIRFWDDTKIDLKPANNSPHEPKA